MLRVRIKTKVAHTATSRTEGFLRIMPTSFSASPSVSILEMPQRSHPERTVSPRPAPAV